MPEREHDPREAEDAKMYLQQFSSSEEFTNLEPEVQNHITQQIEGLLAKPGDNSEAIIGTAEKLRAIVEEFKDRRQAETDYQQTRKVSEKDFEELFNKSEEN